MGSRFWSKQVSKDFCGRFSAMEGQLVGSEIHGFHNLQGTNQRPFFFFFVFVFCFPGKCLIFCWILDENECPFKKWYFRFGIFVFVRKIFFFFFFLKIIEQKTARRSKNFMFVVCGTMEHLGGSRLEWTKNYLCNWIHKVVDEAKRVK